MLPEEQINIAICDDEGIFRNILEQMLSEYMLKHGISYKIEQYNSGSDLVNRKDRLEQYQIIFLDIDMNEMDGITTAKKIREVSDNVFIVFVTAFLDYALNGYEVSAIRYILKSDRNLSQMVYECMDAITQKMKCMQVKKEFSFLEGRKRIFLDQLVYMESKLHKIEFHIKEQSLKKYTLYGKIDEYENLFPKNQFVRVHQSYLVNMKYIIDIYRYEVKISSDIHIPIAKKRYDYVEEKYIDFEGEV